MELTYKQKQEKCFALFDKVLPKPLEVEDPEDPENTKIVYFDHCISNPPYQLEIDKRTLKIYPKFFLSSTEFSQSTAMIFPRGWIYSRGSGQIYEAKHMQNMKTIKHISVYTEDSETPIRIFNEGTGGVSIVVNDNASDNTTSDTISYCYNNVDKGEVKKELIFVESKNMKPEFLPILEKTSEFPSIMHIISGQTRYGIRSTATKKSNYVHTTQKNNTVRLYSNDKTERWVEKEKVNIIPKYKLTMPSTGTYRQHRDSFIMDKNEICDDTYITVEFSTFSEAKNYQKYLGTKFYNFFLSLGTVSHNGTRSTHQFVPDLGDYTSSNSYIDWDIPLDTQLYKLFKLTDEEVKIIENYQ